MVNNNQIKTINKNKNVQNFKNFFDKYHKYKKHKPQQREDKYGHLNNGVICAGLQLPDNIAMT